MIIITATLATIATHYSLALLLNIYAWLDEAGTEVEDPDKLINTLLIRDLMDRDCVPISRETPVTEITRLFTENRMECLPVIDHAGRLQGIVTEHDIFFNEENLPRTDLTYQAIFNEPVTPE